MIILRITSFIILFLSAVFMPWPVVLGLAVIFAAIFPWFLEAVVVGFLLGSLYGLPRNESGFLFAFFVLSFGAVLLVEECLKRVIEGRNILSTSIIAVLGGISAFLIWLLFKLALF